MALVVTKLDAVETFARVPAMWAVFMSLFSTTYILGCLFLAANIGKMDTDQKAREKWRHTALLNNRKTTASDEGKGN